MKQRFTKDELKNIHKLVDAVKVKDASSSMKLDFSNLIESCKRLVKLADKYRGEQLQSEIVEVLKAVQKVLRDF